MTECGITLTLLMTKLLATSTMIVCHSVPQIRPNAQPSRGQEVAESFGIFSLGVRMGKAKVQLLWSQVCDWPAFEAH